MAEMMGWGEGAAVLLSLKVLWASPSVGLCGTLWSDDSRAAGEKGRKEPLANYCLSFQLLVSDFIWQLCNMRKSFI